MRSLTRRKILIRRRKKIKHLLSLNLYHYVVEKGEIFNHGILKGKMKLPEMIRKVIPGIVYIQRKRKK